MTCFGQKSSLLCYLRFLLWSYLLWFLFLSLRDIVFPLIFFTLVSNMQILWFNLIIYTSHSWAASSNLIPPYENGRISSGLLFLGFFCPCLLANQTLGPYPLSEPVLNNYPPSVNNSTFISTLRYSPSIPWFIQKLSLLCYLQFILWYDLLWFLFLIIYDIFSSELFYISLQHAKIMFQFDNIYLP